jgi:hypothetical protein
MKSKHIAAMLFLVLSACADGGVVRSGNDAPNGMVVKRVVKPSTFSGVIASFVEIEAISGDQSSVFLYPYFEENTKLPDIGSRCYFRYGEQEVNGLAGDRFLKRHLAKVVTSFSCE